MKVTLTRHGGLAAGIRRPPCVIESSSLPKPVAEELAQLVMVAKTGKTVAEDKPGSARDAMSYTIMIEDGDVVPFIIRQSDITMAPWFAALLQWLELHCMP
jgi:hypothetical protein